MKSATLISTCTNDSSKKKNVQMKALNLVLLFTAYWHPLTFQYYQERI